jgi:hypothetical protein
MSDILCPHCQSRQSAQAVFCDNCGQRIVADEAAMRLDAPAAPQSTDPTEKRPAVVVAAPAFLRPGPDVAAGRVICPNCHMPNFAGASFCDQCGSSLPSDLPLVPADAAEAAPRGGETPAGRERQSPVEPPSVLELAALQTFIEGAGPRGRAAGRLVILATGAILNFPSDRVEILVGREDPVSNVFPEIDLAQHGGEPGGVSRRHARFVLRGSTVFVEDLQSTNFTFVNRQRVMPGVAQVVRHGDEVRFGRIAARYESP